MGLEWPLRGRANTRRASTPRAGGAALFGVAQLAVRAVALNRDSNAQPKGSAILRSYRGRHLDWRPHAMCEAYLRRPSPRNLCQGRAILYLLNQVPGDMMALTGEEGMPLATTTSDESPSSMSAGMSTLVVMSAFCMATPIEGIVLP